MSWDGEKFSVDRWVGKGSREGQVEMRLYSLLQGRLRLAPLSVCRSLVGRPVRRMT